MTNPPEELQGLAPDQDIQLAYSRLQQMARWQAGFLGTASHELRAPINKIISLHQLILEDLCESPEEEKEFLQQANQAIYQVLQNLDLLIQVSKLDIGAITPRFQTVSVAEMFGIVQQLMGMKSINRQCRLILEPPPQELAVIADRQWLQQLLMLLVDGAITAKGSMITLSAQGQGSTTRLQLATDVPATLWQAPDPQAARTTADQDGTECSPGFRYQVAGRMAAHLNGTITCRETEAGSEISVGLPAGSS